MFYNLFRQPIAILNPFVLIHFRIVYNVSHEYLFKLHKVNFFSEILIYFYMLH